MWFVASIDRVDRPDRTELHGVLKHCRSYNNSGGDGALQVTTFFWQPRNHIRENSLRSARFFLSQLTYSAIRL